MPNGLTRTIPLWQSRLRAFHRTLARAIVDPLGQLAPAVLVERFGPARPGFPDQVLRPPA